MKRLVLLVALGLSLSLGCEQDSTRTQEKPKPEPRQGGSYRGALPFMPKALDPAFSTDIYSVTLIQQLFDGLVQFDQNLNVAPALATSWQVSPDGLTYTFKLRQDAKFHNGRPVTANDFVYSFTRILHPKERASALSFFERIKGADAYRSGKSREVSGLRAVDLYTLEIILKEPFSPFLSVLAMKSSKVVPREEVERWEGDFGHHPVGTGPFRLETWEGDQLLLSANPDYYEGRPHLDRVVYTIYAGAQYDRMFDDFVAGRLEEAAVFGANREQMSRGTKYRFFRKPTLSLQFYGMNCANGPLREKKVRQALNYAIDKERIISQAFGDRFVPAATILPPGMPAYTPENSAYDYDPQKARALLAEAGYGPSQAKLSLTLLSASKSKGAQKELALVAEDLAAVGVELTVQYETDWPTFEATLRSEKLQLYRYAWFADIPDPDNFLNILCSSQSRYNFMRYNNPKVDHLLSQALLETDYLKRVMLYRKAERIILDEAPMIPWMYWTFESAFHPYVKGLAISALGAPYIPLKTIWLDEH
ncbi:MAG: ABC transporter substrate-binding protein [Deltaproteobacteria bacterium]|nr:MAG: ABC transporter substrate-binding protein [Deltaproteobacteria bacterium]